MSTIVPLSLESIARNRAPRPVARRAASAPDKFRGFTLIELLVVIAIIAILAAILFPVFAQARDKARQTTCLNNCKQMGTAVQMYLQDYDEAFPKGDGFAVPAQFGFGANNNIESWENWPWFYGPYVKSVAVFDCPNSPDDTGNLTGVNWANDGNYGYNYSGLNNDQNVNTGLGYLARAYSELDRPAETFVIFDAGDTQVRAGTNNWAGLLEELDLNLNCDANQIGTRYSKEGALRHSGTANVVYADGHAKNIGWRGLLTRTANNVAPWMMTWTDCNPTCPVPDAGAGKCFDPAKIP